MASVVRIYFLGEGRIPEWINEEARKGRIKFNYDEQGELVNAKVISGAKRYTARLHDCIVQTVSGLTVIDAATAKRMKLTPTDNATPINGNRAKAAQVEETTEEETEES